MLAFKQYITEGNELQQKINKHISNNKSVGALSPEGSHTDTPEKKQAAHTQMKSDLESARKAGHIGGWSGPHKGQYQYGGAKDVAREGSYVVHAAGEGKEHHDKMVHSLRTIGKKHDQESVLSVDANKKANWHYLRGAKKGTSVYQGKAKYNVPLRTGTGRTQLKGSSQSFTSEKD